MSSTIAKIQRSRLSKLAGQMSGCRILYIQAPAGYGKTVFAGQWLKDRKEPGAVATLDEFDNTPEDICRKLKYLLEDLYVDAEVYSFTKNPDFDKAPIEFLMRAATVIPKDSRAGIVIDDLHYLTDMHAQRVVRTFLMRLPKGVKACILSRSALPEPFTELILKNELKIIPQDQMLFDISEIYDLYHRSEIAITRKQAEAIHVFTEGWPIGLNALLLSENQIPSESIEGMWLESFLKNEVWEMWDERAREFMLGTCMEEELSEGLCSAMTGEPDSGKILMCLWTEGAFLSRQRGGTYRFHKLFREFLRKMFLERPEKYRVEKIRAAGQWYLEQGKFYQAVTRFSRIRDYDGVAGCFHSLEDMDRAGFDTEQVMYAVREVLDEEIADRYPFLYYMMAFTSRNEGKIAEFETFADQYYENYPRIVERNPELAHNIFFLYTMDFRFTLKDIAKMAENVRIQSTFQGVRGSATLYFPFYHRSYRDFSELLPGDIDASIETLGKTLGPLLGEEGPMLLECVRAGLYYEKGSLQHAQELALNAMAKLKKEFAPESKFCTMALLLMISHAMHQADQEETVQKDIKRMMETDQSYYLQHNFDAVTVRNLLDSGDVTAARKWFIDKETDVYGQLDFFGLYGYFTTARAYIALENFNQAIILLEKILAMCRSMNRTIDVTEAEILLAVSFWKKKRGNQKKALLYLEEALKIAQPLGYKQVFINEGAELETMLCSLKNKTMRSDYTGDLSGTFVNKLYIRAAEQSSCYIGITGGRVEQDVNFTRQQKRVMKLMCEGYSYRRIAEELGIQFSTVRSHIELIYRKLDVAGMKEAVLKINQLHILDAVEISR